MEIGLSELHVLYKLHPARQWASPFVKIFTYLLFLFIASCKELILYLWIMPQA